MCVCRSVVDESEVSLVLCLREGCGSSVYTYDPLTTVRHVREYKERQCMYMSVKV